MLIRADRLIDGTGADPLENATLVIEAGKVAGIIRGDIPDRLAGAELLEFPGGTILPGLIDTHVHLNLPGDGSTLEDAMRESEGVMVATSTHAIARALAAGITTVRDVGAYKTTAIDLRRAQELGYVSGARVMACGQPITITGGHTWYLGGEADGIDGLRRKVRDMIKQGAEFIKVMGSGGGTVGTASWLPAYSQDEMLALADEAHRNGRKVSVHCLCAQSIDIAIKAGADQIEHAGFITDAQGNQVYDAAVADRLAASGIPVTSTLAVGGTVLNALSLKERLTPAEQEMQARWRTMAAENQTQFAKLSATGVKFVAGTDAGWRFTSIDSLPLELELMHAGGYSTLEAIHAATGRAAEVIGIDDQTGTLIAGKAADVIVVHGNPLADLDALRDPRLILQAGVRHAAVGRAAMTPQAAFRTDLTETRPEPTRLDAIL
ncbi:amidohydrolase family protein [Hyphomonas sp.]|uniref:amidohydrolase family protein n=1 Tax=Hyphomonas sp. TaxID=87 RepID=UPI003569CBE9